MKILSHILAGYSADFQRSFRLQTSWRMLLMAMLSLAFSAWTMHQPIEQLVSVQASVSGVSESQVVLTFEAPPRWLAELHQGRSSKLLKAKGSVVCGRSQLINPQEATVSVHCDTSGLDLYQIVTLQIVMNRQSVRDLFNHTFGME